MAKQLNKRLVGFITFLGIGCILTAGFLVLRGLPERDPRIHVDRAKQAYEQGKLDVAAREYIEAFRTDVNKSPDLLARAAEIFWEIDALPEAIRCAERSLTAGPNVAARRLLIEISVSLARTFGGVSRWKAVAEHAQKLLPADAAQRAEFEKTHAADAAKAYAALGESQLIRSAGGADDPTLAASGVANLRQVVYPAPESKAAPLDPSNIDAAKYLRDYWLTRAARAWRTAGGKNVDVAPDLGNALGVIAAVNKAAQAGNDKPKMVDASLLRILPTRLPAEWKLGAPLLGMFEAKDKPEILQLLDRAEKSLQEWNAAAAKTVDQGRRMVELSLAIAQDWQRVNQGERAETILRAAIKEHKDDVRPYPLLGQLLRQRNRLDDEEAVYKTCLESTKVVPGFRGQETAGARAILYDRLVSLNLDRRRKAKDEKAGAAIMAGADEWAKKAAAEVGADAALTHLIRGRILHIRNEQAAAIKELEQVERDPNAQSIAFDCKMLLWDLYTRQGLLGAAEREARSLIGSGTLQPFLMLARTQLLQNKPRAALDTLSPLVQNVTPGSEAAPAMDDVHLTRAEAYKKLAMSAEADRELSLIKGGKAGASDALRAAMIDIDRERFVDAEAKLAKLLTDDPANEEVLDVMMQLYNRQGKRTKILPWLDKAIARKPDDEVLKKLRVFLDEKSTQEQRMKAHEDALKQITDPYARAMSLFDFYQTQGDKQKTQSALDEAEKVKPNGTVVLEHQFYRALIAAAGDEKADPAKRWANAELYARKAAAANADQAGGKTYEGRLALAKSDFLPAGDAAARNSLVQRALELLRQGLEVFPSNPAAWTSLGQAYMNLGRVNEARAAFNKVVGLQPANGQAHWGLALAARQEGDTAEWERQVELAHADARIRDHLPLRAAYDEVQEGRDPKAGITRREGLQKSKPDDVQNLVLLANLYDKAGRAPDALKAYQDAVAQKPASLPVAMTLAQYLKRTDHCADAVSLMENLLKRTTAPTDKARTAIGLARILESCDVPMAAKKAEAMFELAHQTEPSAATATEVGAFLIRTGRMKDAVKWFEEARTRAGSDPALAQGLLKELIRIHLVLRDIPKAEKLLSEFVEKYKDDPDGLILEGTVAMLKGDVGDAISVFADAIRRQPDNVVAYWQRGELYVLAADLPRAADDLRRARDLAPGPPRMPGYQHRIQLAQILVQLGQSNAALDELRSALAHALGATPDMRNVGTLAMANVELLKRSAPPRYSEAEKVLLDVSTRFPLDPTWPLELSKLALEQESHAAALQRATDALGLSRRDPSGSAASVVLQQLVSCHLALDDAGKIASLLSASENAPVVERGPLLGVYLAAARWRQGDAEAGLTTLMTTLKPFTANALGFRALVLNALRLVDADTLLSRVEEELHKQPDQPVALRLRACVLLDKKRPEDAERVTQKLLAAAAPVADRSFMLYLLASHYYAEHKFDLAGVRFRQLIEIDPKNKWALNDYAFLMATELHQPAEALPYAQQATAQNPDDAIYLDTLGWCQALAGKYVEGRGTLLRAIRSSTTSLDARMHLGLTYKIEGKDLAAARQCLELAAGMAREEEDQNRRQITRRQASLAATNLTAGRRHNLTVELSSLQEQQRVMKQTKAKIATALAELKGGAAAAGS